VESVLDTLGVRNRDEQKTGKLFWCRTNLELVVRLVDDNPPKRPLPPTPQRNRVPGVNDHLLPFETHKSESLATSLGVVM
jgi:hypothetical protein